MLIKYKGNVMTNQMRPQPPKLKMKPSRVRDLNEEIIFSTEFEDEFEIMDPELDMALYTALVSRLVETISNSDDLSMKDEEALEDKVIAIISSMAMNQQNSAGTQRLVRRTAVQKPVLAPNTNGNNKQFSLTRMAKPPKNKAIVKTGLATSLIFTSSLTNSYNAAFKRAMKPKMDKQAKSALAFRLKKEKVRQYWDRVDREEEMQIQKELQSQHKETIWTRNFPSLKPTFF